MASDELINCAKSSFPDYFYGLVEGEVHTSTDGTGRDYLRLGVTPYAFMFEPDKTKASGLHTKWDLLELGKMRYIKDDALEVKSFYEISLFQAGRMGAYNWSPDSPVTLTFGAQLSVGWAWAEGIFMPEGVLLMVFLLAIHPKDTPLYVKPEPDHWL